MDTNGITIPINASATLALASNLADTADVRMALHGFDTNGQLWIASRTFTIAGNSTADETFQMPAGTLMGMTVRCTDQSPAPGQLWAGVSLALIQPGGLLDVSKLGCGWVCNRTGPGLGDGIDGPLPRNTSLIRVDGPFTFEAGSEIDLGPSQRTEWEMVAVTARLTAAVAVANRIPILQATLDGEIMVETAVGATVTATGEVTFIWGKFGAVGTPATGHSIVLLPDFALPADSRLGTVTSGLQAADVWSHVMITYYPRAWAG